jgi:hypothetical protein
VIGFYYADFLYLTTPLCDPESNYAARVHPAGQIAVDSLYLTRFYAPGHTLNTRPWIWTTGPDTSRPSQQTFKRSCFPARNQNPPNLPCLSYRHTMRGLRSALPREFAAHAAAGSVGAPASTWAHLESARATLRFDCLRTSCIRESSGGRLRLSFRTLDDRIRHGAPELT